MTALVSITALKDGSIFYFGRRKIMRTDTREAARPSDGSNLNNQKYSNIIEFTAGGRPRLARGDTIKVKQT